MAIIELIRKSFVRPVLLVFYAGLLALSIQPLSVAAKSPDASTLPVNHVKRVTLDLTDLHQPMPFLSHKGFNPFETALARNVAYAPIRKLREQVQEHLQMPLRFYTGWASEGEAHITVITPPEFDQILRPFVSIEDIEAIAQKHQIQRAPFEVLGIGSGFRLLEGQSESTYFLIVRAPQLVKIREAVYRLYVQRGGPAVSWNPREFYPHITLGYTRRDLHLQDGVFKDISALDRRFALEVFDPLTIHHPLESK